MEEMKLSQIRNSTIVAAEINLIKSQTRTAILTASVQIGKLLCEAKTLVAHGDWGTWLENNVEYSQSTANNLMKIYQEYGDEQISIGGSSKSQMFEKLTYSQAVALFALPEGEREEFVKENNVKEMSTRELKEAIEAKKAAERARDTAQAENESLKNEISEIESQIEAAKSGAEENEKLKQIADDAKKELEDLKRLQNEQIKKKEDAARKKAEKELRTTIEKEYESKINQLTLDAESSEKAKEDMEQDYKKRIERMEQELEKNRKAQSLAANENIQKFSVYFDQLQETFNKLTGIIELERTKPDGAAEKLTRALNMLCSGFTSRVGGNGNA